jgi:hypothetical protein
MKKKEAGDEKVMFLTAQENKRMSEPMRKAIADVRRLREEREAYSKDLTALQECKAGAMVVSEQLDALRWAHEILEQRFERLKAERDALAAKFSEAVHEIQQKAGFRALLLEQKLAAAAEEGERAQLLLAEVLAQANVEPGAGGPAAALAQAQGASGLAEVRERERECCCCWAPEHAGSSSFPSPHRAHPPSSSSPSLPPLRRRGMLR